MNASTENAIFSLRIVSIDSYMKKPILGLDSCYSEFRANEIKQVPVIRIFGTDGQGIKTCAHIHGVFPYLYIPFVGDSTIDADRSAYQLASSLDKAINISLGQAHSTTQHIFKIIVVKGIPFYGYHRNEHKYMKIYLYNPSFIRRVANLLQNGAILGRILQPHESHVPFILQFMIDYNLYGMSFLHVPTKTVCYRQQTADSKLNGTTNDSTLENDLNSIHPDQLLNWKIERMSTSQQEIDMDSAFILNRLQVTTEKNEHANPGIAFIWKDERERRKKSSDELPPLKITQESSSDRGEVPITESDAFHQTALSKRLEFIRLNNASPQSSDSFQQNSQNVSLLEQSLNRNRKFNLNQFLQNSVYPAECLDNDSISDKSILNASYLIDHLRSSKQIIGSNESNSFNLQNVQFDPDDTIVDEDLVLSLTQKFSNTMLMNETLNEEEHEVLDVLEVLEDDEQTRDEQACIDDDSVLAQLSQVKESSQKFQKNTKNISFEDSDSDDDLLNELSTSLIECWPDDLTKETGNNLSIPQLDGVCDTPNKKRSARKSITKSVTRSPSRSTKKYVPLNVVITRSPNIPNDSPLIERTRKSDIPLKMPKLCIEKCDANTSSTSPCNSKTFIVSNSQSPEQTTEQTTEKTTEQHPEHENEQISDLLTEQTDKEQQMTNTSIDIPSEHKKIIENSPTVSLIRYKNIEKTFESLVKVNDDDEHDQQNQNMENDEFERRYPKRNRTQRIRYTDGLASKIECDKKVKPKKKKDEKELNKMDFWYSWYKWSDCELARRYDEERGFFPQPGTSTLNYYENENLTGYYRPYVESTTPQTIRKRRKLALNNSIPSRKMKSNKFECGQLNETSSPPHSDNSDWENEIMVQSFYEQSFAQQRTPSNLRHSPDALVSPMSYSPNSDDGDPKNVSLSTPMMAEFLKSVMNTSTDMKTCDKLCDSITIKPNKKPERHNGVLDTMKTHDIPNVIHPIPHYSDPKDLIEDTSNKEIGNIVLQLKGNSLNDCDEFQSQANIVGIHNWQKFVVTNVTRGSKRIMNKNKNSDELNAIREQLANETKSIRIQSVKRAPIHKDIQKWLNTRSKANEKNHNSIHTKPILIDDDSPMKCRREKASAVLQQSDDDDVEIIENDITKNVQKKQFRDDDQINRLLMNKNITLSVVSKSGKKEIIKCDSDDDDDDDVICLDDQPSAKNKSTSVPETQQLNEKLERPSFLKHLNLDDTIRKNVSQNASFGIKAAALDNTYGFRMNLENFQCAKSNIEHNYLTILSLEIHCQTRGKLLPDPKYDEIICMFYAIHNDVPNEYRLPRDTSGILINTNGKNPIASNRLGIPHIHIKYVENEKELLAEFVDLIRFWDPDIFAGYEIELASWGYVIQRSQVINIDLVPLISRIPSQKIAKFKQTDPDAQQEEFMGIEYESEYKLYGRILLDVWRLLRAEIALTSYSFENIMYHVMHRRYPLYSFEKLSRLWNESLHRWIVIEYYMDRTNGTLEIMNQLDLVGRTCELAKLFGIQFYEVLSRGSQFRVESMMLRIAKPKNLIPVSPSVQQRAHMRAPEYLPLILEPHSRFYSDPLIVLDFQSLYPSVIIAYNYCFSTCLGRLWNLGPSNAFEFGASQLRVPRRLVESLMARKLIHISPSGAVFVKSSVREGVLPRMLREILDTRLMVKQSMKLYKTDKLLQRILHSRQLGLKLMANVTYGYTAANFSGRMPCVEVGDSVVSKGRETLERAIKTVEANEKWGCRVVYGDTDSMFVLVPGRSREEAFRIGAEIAKTVTQQNPFPICLKLEKVYQPSILQTKKRYVGYMYESAEQTAAVYEAKGIETVRRDGCPAVAKMLEKTLRIIFETYDISAVKRYVCRQFTKILSGQTNIQDLIFAKEFRGVNGYKPGACVPSLELTRQSMQIDPRAEPRRGERVQYLVINGPPGLPLIRLVRSPHEYLTNEALKINAMYYITKVLIPPLNRCLLLIGADVNQWFTDLPRKSQLFLSLDIASNIMKNKIDQSVDHLNDATKKSTISQYFSSTNCVCDCGKRTHHGICSMCLEPNRRQESALILAEKCRQLERKLTLCLNICTSCCNQSIDSKCISLDCSVLFMLNRWIRDSKQIQFYRQLIDQHF